MDWYGPLTVLPAIGLLVMSTSNFIVSLNNEIFMLEKEANIGHEVITLKLAQLKRLGYANAFLYASALLFLIAGILKALLENDYLFYCLMLIGLVTTTLALALLFIHSLKSIAIRQKNLKI